MWAREPQVLANYAKHYQTGAPMPKALLDKVLAAQKFNQGFATHRVPRRRDARPGLAPAAARRSADGREDVHGVRGRLRSEGRRRLRAGAAALPHHLLLHIFAGGYSAGYYAYIWSEVLARDTGEWFNEHGGLTRENGDTFRKTMLSRGRTDEPSDAVPGVLRQGARHRAAARVPRPQEVVRHWDPCGSRVSC